MTLGEMLEHPSLKEIWETETSRYPIFSEAYREHLNTVILEHYINREIAHENTEQFFLSFRRKMRINMPQFNKMYLAQLKNVDPLLTMDIETDSEAKGLSDSKASSISESESTAENKSRGVTSANPQMRLATNGDYASGMSDSTGEATSLATGNQNDSSVTENESTSKSRVKGFSGAASELIANYIDSLVNVDELIIESLAPCFFGLWNTSHAYTQSRGIY